MQKSQLKKCLILVWDRATPVSPVTTQVGRAQFEGRREVDGWQLSNIINRNDYSPDGGQLGEV